MKSIKRERPVSPSPSMDELGRNDRLAKRPRIEMPAGNSSSSSEEDEAEVETMVDEPDARMLSPATTVDNYEVWMIQKPATISMDQLQGLTLPSRAEIEHESFLCRTFKTPDGVTLDCRFQRTGDSSQLLHVPIGNAKTPGELGRLEPASVAVGTVFITRHFDDPLQLDDGESAGFPFRLGKIWRKPKFADLETARQRLTAFGVKSGNRLPRLVSRTKKKPEKKVRDSMGKKQIKQEIMD